ncbi:hypothetical protein AX15_006864 [Amanita polypyramis BW_CC]|nr:hypothetical protein AX15_006864 [Amanita polypyramis BW_CC]
MGPSPPIEKNNPRKNNTYDTVLTQLGEVGLIVAAVFVVRRVYTRYIKRIPNANHITPAMLEKKRKIQGMVTSVGDADGFRLYHTPEINFRKVPTTPKELKGQTISIRIAGVDAPEGAHFGRPAQPFAIESHTWLKKRILKKKVYCQLLHRDQYSRIVANVHVPGLFFRKNLALEMLRAGWATTYEQASAQYGEEGKEAYLEEERKAK